MESWQIMSEDTHGFRRYFQILVHIAWHERGSANNQSSCLAIAERLDVFIIEDAHTKLTKHTVIRHIPLFTILLSAHVLPTSTFRAKWLKTFKIQVIPDFPRNLSQFGKWLIKRGFSQPNISFRRAWRRPAYTGTGSQRKHIDDEATFYYNKVSFRICYAKSVPYQRDQEVSPLLTSALSVKRSSWQPLQCGVWIHTLDVKPGINSEEPSSAFYLAIKSRQHASLVLTAFVNSHRWTTVNNLLYATWPPDSRSVLSFLHSLGADWMGMYLGDQQAYALLASRRGDRQCTSIWAFS